METKVKFKISEYAISEMNKCSTRIEAIEKVLERDFFNAFEWSMEELFKSKYKKKQLIGFLSFIQEQPERTVEWLEFNVKTIQEKVMRGKFLGRSTSIFANLVYTFEMEEDCELAKIYETYIEWIKKDKMEII